MQIRILALCLFAVSVRAADIYTLDVPPAVTAESAAGVTSGWGYSLNNQSSSLWLVTTDLSADTFQYAVPDLVFDFPDLAPSTSVSIPYDPIAATGLFAIKWDANAPPDFVNSGAFILTAQWWSGDPLHGGTLVGPAPLATVPYSVSLNTVPEPATLGPVGLMLLIFLIAAVRCGPGVYAKCQ